MRIEALSYPEVEAAIARGAVALWPIGATEAHGPHLPLATDVVIAAETCRRAAEPIERWLGLCALELPALAFSVAEFAKPFAGTVSIPRETAVAYVRDVAAAVAAQGFRAIVLVNAHLEPAHRFALRDAVKAARGLTGVPIGIADPADARWAETLTEEFRSGSCHAGRYETSLVLAAGSEALRSKAWKQLPANPIDLIARIKGGSRDFREAGAPEAYCGDPAAATAAEGEASYARLVEIVVSVLGELLGGGGHGP